MGLQKGEFFNGERRVSAAIGEAFCIREIPLELRNDEDVGAQAGEKVV
jgi:hypothetical protein